MAEPEPDPLSGRSLPELREMLQRQERLLGDRALVSRLPDGGERVRGCAARLRAAVATREEQRRSGDGGGRGFPGPTEPPTAALAAALGGLSLGALPVGAPAAEKERRRSEDVTAARPAPLRHAPVQLLPLAESVAIQVQQEQARQEMQAKGAAQKLAERLGIKMVHREPEGKRMTSYREGRDEEGDSSAED